MQYSSYAKRKGVHWLQEYRQIRNIIGTPNARDCKSDCSGKKSYTHIAHKVGQQKKNLIRINK